jgi:hypothetical protein
MFRMLGRRGSGVENQDFPRSASPIPKSVEKNLLVFLGTSPSGEK